MVKRGYLDHPFWTRLITASEYISFLSLTILFIYLRERERERVGGGAEKKGERETQAGSALRVGSDTELNPRTLRSWPAPKSGVGHLADWVTQAPHFRVYFCWYLNIQATFIDWLSYELFLLIPLIIMEVKSTFLIQYNALLALRKQVCVCLRIEKGPW